MSILICQEFLKGVHPLWKFLKCKLLPGKSLSDSNKIMTSFLH